ncbi:hypothetical protein SPI_08259 [Niveomyces insectorum RCEF 264]|uniref:DUF7053 domain-containing protein n=1 Tax=Niveomyces insectorum RCEF 264 TaxID=1081102 RepID=A0A162IDF6_9HYPO|nr:hypothetical protein SPI_08259 [Niveomyces insectorum RCEF 264]
MPTLDFAFACPLPPGCPPGRVLHALHRFEPLITPNPYLVSYRRRPVDLAEIVDDPFFREDGQALAAFEIVDRIVFLPGVATKQVVIPCVMQRFADGVRCRSLAAGGVRVWSTWRVVPAGTVAAGVTTAAAAAAAAAGKQEGGGRRRSSRESHERQQQQQQTLTPPATPQRSNDSTASGGGGGSGDSGRGYELVEEARVECSTLVKPFVGRSFQAAHLLILRTVVQEIMRETKMAVRT